MFTNVTFRLLKIIKLNVVGKITAISACNRQATLILRGVVVMQEVYKNCLQDNPLGSVPTFPFQQSEATSCLPP